MISIVWPSGPLAQEGPPGRPGRHRMTKEDDEHVRQHVHHTTTPGLTLLKTSAVWCCSPNVSMSCIQVDHPGRSSDLLSAPSKRTRMSDFQNEMNRTVQSFVAQITELARRAAIDTLESAFTGRAARGSA